MDIDRQVLFCPHCGNTTPQKLVYSHANEVIAYDEDGEKSDFGPPSEYFVRICETCNDLLVYFSVIDDTPELLYPESIELPACVPQKVRDCYLEAAKIKNIAPNAFAVMIRRGLETVCEDRNAKKGSLQERLEILAENGDIPPTLVEVTSILRILGNIGAHSSLDKITVPMTWGMDEFFRAIIEYVYIAPDKVNEFKRKIKSK